jgi:ribosomal protein S12 methylthiotransferase
MRTRTTQPRKVNVVTLGCAKNIYDSEVLMGQLRAKSYDVEHEFKSDDAGIVTINTCGFIKSAKQESIDTFIRFSQAKEQGMVDRVYVTGCLSERYKDELQDGIPEVDAWFGIRELPRLLKTLRADYKRDFAEVEIQSATEFDLHGKLV